MEGLAERLMRLMLDGVQVRLRRSTSNEALMELNLQVRLSESESVGVTRLIHPEGVMLFYELGLAEDKLRNAIRNKDVPAQEASAT